MSDDVKASSLTVQKLKQWLTARNVSFPLSGAKKAQYVELVEAEQRRRALKRKKPTSTGRDSIPDENPSPKIIRRRKASLKKNVSALLHESEQPMDVTDTPTRVQTKRRRRSTGRLISPDEQPVSGASRSRKKQRRSLPLSSPGFGAGYELPQAVSPSDSSFSVKEERSPARFVTTPRGNTYLFGSGFQTPSSTPTPHAKPKKSSTKQLSKPRTPSRASTEIASPVKMQKPLAMRPEPGIGSYRRSNSNLVSPQLNHTPRRIPTSSTPGRSPVPELQQPVLLDSPTKIPARSRVLTVSVIVGLLCVLYSVAAWMLHEPSPPIFCDNDRSFILLQPLTDHCETCPQHGTCSDGQLSCLEGFQPTYDVSNQWQCSPLPDLARKVSALQLAFTTKVHALQGEANCGDSIWPPAEPEIVVLCLDQAFPHASVAAKRLVWAAVETDESMRVERDSDETKCVSSLQPHHTVMCFLVLTVVAHQKAVIVSALLLLLTGLLLVKYRRDSIRRSVENDLIASVFERLMSQTSPVCIDFLQDELCTHTRLQGCDKKSVWHTVAAAVNSDRRVDCERHKQGAVYRSCWVFRH